MVAQGISRSSSSIDWVLVLLFSALVFIGLANIYAATYSSEVFSITDFRQSYIKQLVWISTSIVIAIFILQVDSKFFSLFSYGIFASMIFLLLLVLLFGKEVNGARSWFEIGSVRLQPAEFAKFATSLAVAKYLSSYGVSGNKFKDIVIIGGIALVPFGLILLQNDLGSALVYGSLALVLYREGMPGWVLLVVVLFVVLFIGELLSNVLTEVLSVISVTLAIYLFISRDIFKTLASMVSITVVATGSYFIAMFLGQELNLEYVLTISILLNSIVFFIYAFRKRLAYVYYLLFFVIGSIGFSLSVDYVFNNVLSNHHRTRIEVLLGLKQDPSGVGYNVHQSKVAIGSGGLYGKGFLQGTQNKGEFVPEQSTDFIFCTVGEEWGFVGSTAVIILFVFFLLRLISLAEKQRSPFSRVYGYCVAAIIFFHMTINIGMTIGLIPVIGIPLPFFSYGGSSLWAFTILVFIFVRLDSSRDEIL